MNHSPMQIRFSVSTITAHVQSDWLLIVGVSGTSIILNEAVVSCVIFWLGEDGLVMTVCLVWEWSEVS